MWTGVQFLIFGVLADLLVSLHEEQRQRLERIARDDATTTDVGARNAVQTTFDDHSHREDETHTTHSASDHTATDERSDDDSDDRVTDDTAPGAADAPTDN